MKLIDPSAFMSDHNFWLHDNGLRITMNYELSIKKYIRVVSLFINKYITSNLSQNERHFRKFIKTTFTKVNERDLVRKIIKSVIMFHLKRIWKFSNEEEKWTSEIWTFFYLSYNSHFFHTKRSVVADLKYNCFFSYLYYLMKFSTSKVAINGQPWGAGAYVFKVKPRQHHFSQRLLTY